MAPTCLKEKTKSHNCRPGPTGQAPHAPNLPSSNHRTGFLRGGHQVPRSRSQRLAFPSSALSSLHGPLVDLRPTSNPSSLIPPQLPGLTHLSSRLGRQGRRLPRSGKRRPEVKGPPGTRMEVKGDGSSPPQGGRRERRLASNRGGQSPQAHAASPQSSGAQVIPPTLGQCPCLRCVSPLVLLSTVFASICLWFNSLLP